jgi:hypothetical protein
MSETTLSGADKEKLECALGLMTDLLERCADPRTLTEEAAQYDLNDDLWLMTQILGLAPEQREMLVQAFLCAEGKLTATQLKGGVLLASEPAWDAPQRIVPIEAVSTQAR